MTGIYIATEDELSEAVVYRLIEEANHGLTVSVPMRAGGFGYLKNKAPDLLKLAHNVPVFLLADLDTFVCPSALHENWLGTESILPDDLLFRIAVREVEAWLLADREGFAAFTGAPVTQIPTTPETLADPKATLLHLVNRYGKREQKVGIVRKDGTNLKQGLEYNLQLGQFVADKKQWSLERALINANSLSRAYHRLCELSVRYLL